MPLSKKRTVQRDGEKMSNEIKFEEALEKLENSVKRLEGGNVSLEEALAEFEEAVKLVKICNDKLEQAEQKVKMLVENLDGSVDLQSFDTNYET